MNRTYVSRSLAAAVTLALLLLAAGALSAAFADPVAGQSATPDGRTLAIESRSTPIGNTGCEKNATDPHRAASTNFRDMKGFGEIRGPGKKRYCLAKKDTLFVRTTLWIKGDNGDTTWNVADIGRNSCTTCARTAVGATSPCNNNNSNRYYTSVYVYIKNNGNVVTDRGFSNTVTRDCGPG